MGVTGLHNFLKHSHVDGLLVKHTLEDILNDIRTYEE
jgi:hypothetical protein